MLKKTQKTHRALLNMTTCSFPNIFCSKVSVVFSAASEFGDFTLGTMSEFQQDLCNFGFQSAGSFSGMNSASDGIPGPQVKMEDKEKRQSQNMKGLQDSETKLKVLLD